MSYPEKHIAIVCNPTHENARAVKITESISLLLSGMDIKHTVFIEPWPVQWDDITEVWIVGGDGTLNYFINHYPDIRLPLSLFKGGTGNDFHWMLYGEITVEQQVERVLSGRPDFIDGGICNEKLFLNGVGIGFDGAIVKDLLGKRKHGSKASYLFSIIRNIVGYTERPYLLEMENNIIKQDCFMVSVANAKRYGGSYQVAPKASLTDGLLDINIIGKISPFKRMKYLPVIEKGDHLDLPFIQYLQTDKITISSPAVLPAHMDGEYMCSDIFEIHCLPKRFSFIW